MTATSEQATSEQWEVILGGYLRLTVRGFPSRAAAQVWVKLFGVERIASIQRVATGSEATA